MIAARGAHGGKWDINDGVAFFNFANETARAIIQEWWHRFEVVVTDYLLQETEMPWGNLPNGDTFPDDQAMLHALLIENPGYQDALFVESEDFMNYNGIFIRQVLRATGLSNADRAARLGDMARDVRARFPKPPEA
jgi:hypothetical protein